MAKLVFALQPILVFSLELTWCLPSWKIKREEICLSRCHHSNDTEYFQGVVSDPVPPDVYIPALGVL